MRFIAGVALTGHAVAILRTETSIEATIGNAPAIIAGLLLFAGLWTPVAGGSVAVFEIWNTYSQPGDPWAKVLVGTLGVALSLLGPGAWSLDARLFGWKRIDFTNRKELELETRNHQKSR